MCQRRLKAARQMIEDDSDNDKKKQSLLSHGAPAPERLAARFGSILSVGEATNENDPVARHRARPLAARGRTKPAARRARRDGGLSRGSRWPSTASRGPCRAGRRAQAIALELARPAFAAVKSRSRPEPDPTSRRSRKGMPAIKPRLPRRRTGRGRPPRGDASERGARGRR